MSRETTRDVYNNGHCRVVVELFPEEVQIQAKQNVPWNETFIRPLATIRVFAKDIAANHCWPRHVFPGNEQVGKMVGHLWWRKRVIVSESTQEERLERKIIEAIKFADSHFEDFKKKVEIGDQAIRSSENLISAIKEVEKITGGNGE